MSGPAAPGGVLVVDKPAGLTSHDVVARARRLLGTRRVGHAGTLDPMATGVLVLGVDWSTRLLSFMTGHDKAYAATVRLGVGTVTDDAEGDVLATADARHLTPSDLLRGLRPLVGEIDQVPSAVSAIKVGGKRAYARVRAGEDVDLPPRRVRVAAITVTACRAVPPEPGRHAGALDVDMTCEVSAGTYVRALARDLGAALGVGGHLTRLRRTGSGPFVQAEAVTLPDPGPRTAPAPGIEPPPVWRARLMPPATAACRFLPHVTVDEATATRLGHGQRPPFLGTGAQRCAVLDPAGRLVAVVEDTGGPVRPLLVVPAA